MVARAFCELFVAGCLEVKHEEANGEVRRLYRAAEDVDTTLLGRVEQIVVRCLRSWRSFDALLELTAEEASGQKVPRLEAQLLAEMGETIDEALEYLPPACSCSV
jgi:hypothetical protein